MVIKKMLAKDKNVYAILMDLEKACDSVDWEAMWDVFKAKACNVGVRMSVDKTKWKLITIFGVHDEKDSE